MRAAGATLPSHLISHEAIVARHDTSLAQQWWQGAMTRLRLHRLASRFTGVAALVFAATAVANAANCPRQDMLGTSRVLAVDAKVYPRVGLNSFPKTLPLADHEVVLTFDDGPRPPSTQKVLAALAAECVRATFFLVGRSSAEFPELVRRIAAEGHTIAHHGWSHPMMSKIPFEQAKEDIDRGIAADELALDGISTKNPSTPFFRFPYFASTPAMLDLLQSRGIVVFGADVWASDWENISPDQELNNAIKQLESARKGIILLPRCPGANGRHDAGLSALSARERISDRRSRASSPEPAERRNGPLMP